MINLTTTGTAKIYAGAIVDECGSFHSGVGLYSYGCFTAFSYIQPKDADGVTTVVLVDRSYGHYSQTTMQHVHKFIDKITFTRGFSIPTLYKHDYNGTPYIICATKFILTHL